MQTLAILCFTIRTQFHESRLMRITSNKNDQETCLTPTCPSLIKTNFTAPRLLSAHSTQPLFRERRQRHKLLLVMMRSGKRMNVFRFSLFIHGIVVRVPETRRQLHDVVRATMACFTWFVCKLVPMFDQNLAYISVRRRHAYRPIISNSLDLVNDLLNIIGLPARARSGPARCL